MPCHRDSYNWMLPCDLPLTHGISFLTYHHLDHLQGKEITLSKGSKSAASDLYFEPFRWDQKFSAFLIAPKDASKVEPHPELLALAEATGGEVIVCRGLSKTLSNMKAYVHRVLAPSVTVKLANESGIAPGVPPPTVMVNLVGRTASEWY